MRTKTNGVPLNPERSLWPEIGMFPAGNQFCRISIVEDALAYGAYLGIVGGCSPVLTVQPWEAIQGR